MGLWTIAGIGAAAVFLLMWLTAWILSRAITHPRVRESDAAADEICTLMGVSRKEFEREHPVEPFELRSEYGYTLRGYVMPRRGDAPADGRERVVIFVHGYTACSEMGWKYADIFLRRGFVCVFYDHRNHGRSDRRATTMGRLESDDLLTVYGWARERFGADAYIGFHGESMGASTVMLAAPRAAGLTFAIEDCGYSDLRAELDYVCANRYHIPRIPFIAMASLIYRADAGVFFKDVVPRDGVAKTGDLPMLFVHGEADTFVPTEMVYENYAAKETGYKQKFTVPGAGHAESALKDPAGYDEAVGTFLAVCGVD